MALLSAASVPSVAAPPGVMDAGQSRATTLRTTAM